MRIVAGISGGIAAYKAVGVIRLLVKAGHEVQVVATESALRFIGRPTLEAISRNPVHDSVYEGVAEVRHVALGQRADAIVVAPATANTMAKLAHGLADDLLGTTVLASRAPLVLAPAMHTEMWENPATRANAALLRERGAVLVGPERGELTGADSGIGRMAEPEAIVAAVLAAAAGAGASAQPQDAHSSASHDLAGRSILITSGGTREALDPVRYIGNRSSGKQGVALAEAARDRGARVHLVAANLEVAPPSGVEVTEVVSTAELQQAVTALSGAADTVIMAAAVADYRPVEVAGSKLKKQGVGEQLSLELVQNPDILQGLAQHRQPGQTIVGFAAETVDSEEELLHLGREKLARKGADLLVLNPVGWEQGFGADRTAAIVIDASGDIVVTSSGTKRSVADAILDALIRG